MFEHVFIKRARERESGRAAECAQCSSTFFVVFLVILEMCWNCVSVLFALLICHTLFNTRQWEREGERTRVFVFVSYLQLVLCRSASNTAR